MLTMAHLILHRRVEAKKLRKDQRLMTPSLETGSCKLRRLGEARSVFSTHSIR
jgi:hypothetical protein